MHKTDDLIELLKDGTKSKTTNKYFKREMYLSIVSLVYLLVFFITKCQYTFPYLMEIFQLGFLVMLILPFAVPSFGKRLDM